jgi:hypothetical protein
LVCCYRIIKVSYSYFHAATYLKRSLRL